MSLYCTNLPLPEIMNQQWHINTQLFKNTVKNDFKSKEDHLVLDFE